MTASSLQFLSSCRVQLIGLPQTTTGTTPTTPQNFIKTRVSRNLFGNAPQGEIKQLLENELHENWQRFRQRYSFDIITNNSIKNKAVVNIKETERQELRISAINSDSKSSDTLLDIESVKINGSNEINCSNADRLKPYSRQSLITDCYNFRKLTHCQNKIKNMTTSGYSLSKTSTINQKTANIMITPSQSSLCHQPKVIEVSPVVVVVALSDEPSSSAAHTEESSTDNITSAFTTSNNFTTSSVTISTDLSHRENKADAAASKKLNV